MKKTVFLLICALGLAACGEEGQTQNAPSAVAAAASAPSKQPLYRVAVEIDIPFTVQGPNGTIGGFDDELLRAIGAKQGFDVKFEPYSRTGMFDALADKKAEITASGIYLNDERKTRFEATEPYMESSTVFLVREGTHLSGLHAMQGKKISVKSKTVAEGLAKQVLGADNFETHPTLWMAFKDLVTGRADAILGDEASLRHYAKQYPQEKLLILDTVGRQKEYYVFLVQKGDTQLLNKLNQGLAQAQADGTYKRLYDKWFERRRSQSGS